MIFNHLLILGFNSVDKQIINAGTIKIYEKITNNCGVTGPTGVVRINNASILPGLIISKKSQKI